MFNLEKAMSDWRNQLAVQGISRPEVLDELEDHLRQEIKEQVRIGSTAQGAFETASQKIGSTRALKQSFIKSVRSSEDGERRCKLMWMGIGGLVYAAPIALNGQHLLSKLSVQERWLAVAAFAFTIMSLFAPLIAWRFMPVFPDRHIRTKVQLAILLPVLIWLGVFAFVMLPAAKSTFGGLLVTALWALSPLALGGGVVFGLDEAAWRRRFSAGQVARQFGKSRGLNS